MTYSYWEPKTVICKRPGCGVEFIQNSPGHLYHTKECRRLDNLDTSICPQCGKEFQHPRVVGRPQITCSASCASKYGRAKGKKKQRKTKPTPIQRLPVVRRPMVTAATFQAAAPEKFARMVCDCDLVPTAILARRSETAVSGIVFKERRGKSGRVRRGARV